MKELRRYGMHNEAGIVLRGIRTNGMTDQELGEFAAFAGNYVTEEEFLQYASRIKIRLQPRSRATITTTHEAIGILPIWRKP